MAQRRLQRMVAGRAGELEEPDGVESRERPELFEDAAIKSCPVNRISQVRSVDNSATVQSSQRNNVDRPLLRQVSTLRPDISNRKQVFSWQSFFNRQAHVCGSWEIVRGNVSRADVDVCDCRERIKILQVAEFETSG